MRTETAAADAARGMRQRIDENRVLYCETLQPTNDAIYATNEMPGCAAVRLGAVALDSLRCLAVRLGRGLVSCGHAFSTTCLNG